MELVKFLLTLMRDQDDDPALLSQHHGNHLNQVNRVQTRSEKLRLIIMELVKFLLTLRRDQDDNPELLSQHHGNHFNQVNCVFSRLWLRNIGYE